MDRYGKRVILTMSQSSELDQVLKKRNDYASCCYRKLKNLPVLTNAEFLCDVPVPCYISDNNCEGVDTL